MSSNNTGSKNLPLIFGVVIGLVAVAALVAGSLWQQSVESSKLDEAESHALVASHISVADEEATIAAALLNEYIVTGDAALIPEIQGHAAAGVQALSAAVDEAGSDEGQFLASGSTAIEGVGQIIALREGGDAATAAAALEQLSPAFTALVTDLNEFAAEQQALSVSATDSASSADTAGSWLAVAAGAVALILGLVIAVSVARGLRRRRTVGVPTPL